MKKFKNILFATQGLPGHSDALEQAIQLAYITAVNLLV